MLWHIYLVEKCNDKRSNIPPTYTNSGNRLRSHPARRRIPSCKYFYYCLNDLKNKLVAEESNEVSENIVRLKMTQKMKHRTFSMNTGRRHKP